MDMKKLVKYVHILYKHLNLWKFENELKLDE